VLGACGVESVAGSDAAIVPTTVPFGGDLMACSAIEGPGPIELGDLGGMANPDEEVMATLMAYADDHRDVFGGLWIDRDHGGTVVLAFTDDPDMHLAAIFDLLPTAGDSPVIDTVRAAFTEDELFEIEASIPTSQLPITSTWIDTIRNRVGIVLVDPTEADLDTLAASAPSDALCTGETRTPQPPIGPLEVIPAPGSDPLVSCLGSPPFPASALRDPVPVELSAHPAARAFLDQLADQSGMEPMPVDGWMVAAAEGEVASFLRSSDDLAWMATMELTAAGWRLTGTSAAEVCEPVVVLPEGTGEVTWRLDPTFPAAGPDDTTLHLEVTERGCANGEPMGERLLGPQVVETDAQVLIAFAAVNVVGGATCPANPSTAVTVDLSAPLGDRELKDGTLIPLG
jgi:hypothetical protein